MVEKPMAAPLVHPSHNTPAVSFLCPTFRRAGTPFQFGLEEVIESFRKQTWENKELLILNDDPTQKLVCSEDIRGLKIINASARYPTLGRKRNAMLDMAAGDIILLQDDDDISLPWRAADAVTALANFKGEEVIWRPYTYYVMVNGEPGIKIDKNPGHRINCCAGFKNVFKRLRFKEVTIGEDKLFKEDAIRSGVLRERIKENLRLSYIYRWGYGYHTSSFKEEEAHGVLANVRRNSGVISLTPQWKIDYIRAVNKEIRL